ncbi:MAG: BamA/TamA family outer membrane protein [Proteobacteria bacterium]|nr:BamA/TamA family outer membrane protein [Pseudomonadota bacterium]
MIGEIRVSIGDIFDPTIPSEDRWLYRTANKLHINTRQPIIRHQLLFKSGEPYVQRLVDETERILRANDYLYDAWIRPLSYDGKTVVLEVRTRDTWTLNPGINYSRQGGANTSSVEIEEKNLLGNGQRLSFGWDNDVDRESLNFEFFDPHFHSTWTRLGVVYSDADDGSTQAIRLDRPFYSFDTRHAGGAYLFDSIRNEPRYAYGKNIGEYEQDEQFVEAYGGKSQGWKDGWVRRWTAGATYHQKRFDEVVDEPLGGPLPADLELAYPWVGFDLIEDVYQERTNLDQIERTEDVLLGLRAGGRIGYASEAFGSDRDALILSAYAQNGWEFGSERSLFATAVATGRVEDDGLRNAALSAEARFYARTSEKTKFFATINATVSEALDADRQVLLGGEEGLRGYPLRYQAGTSKALLTLEQRYYTGWYPFRLFHVAGAAFFDMGRTWGTDVTGATSDGLLKDVGIGLRLGSSRSAFGNVVHIDLAFPLDGGNDIDSVQLVVETKARF